MKHTNKYIVGLLDKPKKPIKSKITQSVEYDKFLDAYKEARRRSHHESTVDFTIGGTGDTIALAQLRDDKLVGMWIFDKNAREQTVLALPA